MNKNYNLKLDLKFRCNNSIMKFNQFDNNTSDFFIKISSGGKSFDVEKAIVVLATIKPSGKVASQFVEVKNDVVYADLKPNMKDEIGIYTARAMLILEDERVVTESISYEVEEDKIFSLLNDTVEDTEDFTLLTDMLNRLSTIEISEEQRVINEAERILSEENRKIEEAKRVEAELIRQHEEADRSKYDATRESNENIRKQNESIRLANETNRIDEEAKRVEEEAKRVEAEQLRKDNYNFMTEDEERRRSEANAHKEAEKLRAQAETNRVNEEAKRRTTEQARISAENTRVSNENTRKANETTRQNNETHRVEAETQRQNRYNSFIADAEANANNFENYTNSAKIKEEERKANELDRKSQEDRRVSNEVERISNENTRKANEKARQNNETTRQNIFENKVDEVDKKIVELNTTKDNFVSNINTKVDTKISEIDNVKDNFVSSVNTKVDSKISELDSAKSDMTNTVASKVNEVERRFNALTSQQQQSSEIIDAREGEISLKARLDRDIEKAKQVYANVEGSYISTDSSSGYLKDIEILGNTIQDASNLADIRSVGDKVEGQELYEIPVLSCNERYSHHITSNSSRVDFVFDEFLVSGIAVVNKSDKPIRPVLLSENGSFVNDGVIDAGCTYVIPSGNKVKKITLYTHQGWDMSNDYVMDDIMSIEGAEKHKLTILSPTPLEKVGDVVDRIIEKDGVWGVEKNVKTKNINTNIFSSRDFNNENYIRWYKPNSGEFMDCIYNTEINGYCDKYEVVSDLASQRLDKSCICILGSESIYRLMLITPSEIDTVAKLNDYVSSNPFLVKYPTTTPTFIPLPHDQQVKLRTFAGKTNISFLTEIEGTIKAQVPKSLGATVNTHTEQIRSLNNELNRVKKLEESTVSTVTTESDFTTVEATSNGYFEDVKLEGKTLVNKFNNQTFDSIPSGGLNYIPVDKMSKGDTFSPGLLPNGVQYGIFYNHNANLEKNYSSDTSPYIVTKDIQNVRVYYKNTSSSVINSFTTKSMLLEGDHTQNPPNGYIEGLKSVGQDVDEIVVSSTDNGNLTDGTFIKGSTNASTGDLIFSTGGYSFVTKDIIPVFPNHSLKWKSIGTRGFRGADNTNVIYYGKNNEYLYRKVGFTTFTDIEIPTGCYGVRIMIADFELNTATTADMYKVHTTMSNNTTNLDIVKTDKKRLLYYNEETQAWEKPILREWDSIEKHTNGKYYYHKRSGEAKYVGESSERWQLASTENELGNLQFSIPNTEIGTNSWTLKALCNNFVIRGHMDNNIPESLGLNGYGRATMISIHKSKLPTQDVQGFKQWLQANNVTVVYQLAEEKVYECTNIDLITYANETNYVVNSGAIVPKTTLKVHNNISNVVSLLQKKVSLLESNITNYMITQNRLMLASRYNADTVSFKVDVATLRNSFEYDNDLYELILNNILVGKDNYNREYIENLIIFYWMDFIISDEMYSTLFEIIEEQHNPKIEEETPLI